MESRLAWAGAALWALASLAAWWALPFALIAALLLWTRPRYHEAALALLCAAYLVLTLALAPWVWIRALIAAAVFLAIVIITRRMEGWRHSKLALLAVLLAAAAAAMLALPIAAPLLVLLSLRR
jgi:hypothetical protein